MDKADSMQGGREGEARRKNQKEMLETKHGNVTEWASLQAGQN